MNIPGRLASIDSAQRRIADNQATLDHYEAHPHLRMHMGTVSGESDVTDHELGRIRGHIQSDRALIEKLNRWE